jgi:hypothetical protein
MMPRLFEQVRLMISTAMVSQTFQILISMEMELGIFRMMMSMVMAYQISKITTTMAMVSLMRRMRAHSDSYHQAAEGVVEAEAARL